MLRTILVPLDGSLLGEQALPAAARLARAAGATIHLTHVHTPNSLQPIVIEGMPVIDDQMRSLAADHERAYLGRAAERLAAEGVAAQADRLEGLVAPALAAHAAAIGADLIVLTSHGRSGFEQLWLGSVAEALIRCAPAPLLLLRPGADGVVEGGPFRRIVVPLDGSPLAAAALPHAMALAGLEGGELTLVRAVDTLPVPERMPFAERYRRDEATLAAARATAEAELGLAAEQLRSEGARVSTLVVEGPQPARAIIAGAREAGADLLALATHGRGGLGRALLGSVADKLLRGSGLPALIYRPAEG